MRYEIWNLEQRYVLKFYVNLRILLNKVKSKYPAIILAANRTVKVPNRMIFLIFSIHTIKDIKTGGVIRSIICRTYTQYNLPKKYSLKNEKFH